jgi:integrase
MKRFFVHNVTKKIQNDEVVKDWLEDLSPSARRTYLTTISEFCKISNQNPIDLLKIAKQEHKEDKASWERETIKWFKDYEQHSLDYDRSRNTYNGRLIIIKSFFNFHDIKLPEEKKKKRRKKIEKFKVKNKRPGLLREQIKEALDASKWVRLKAMALTQCSSGLSVTDLVNLTLEQYKKGLISIGEGRQICMIHLKEGRQKGEKEFYTFLSFEAVEEIGRYIQLERYKNATTPYLFTALYHDSGLTEGSFQVDLRRLNHKLGLKAKEKGLHRPITSHMFRKFFYTQLSNANMPYEIRKHLMGHVMPAKVDDSYYLDNPNKLTKKYIEYMPELLIFKYESVKITTTDEEVEKMKEERAQDRAEMQAMKEQNKQMEHDLKLVKTYLKQQEQDK